MRCSRRFITADLFGGSIDCFVGGIYKDLLPKEEYFSQALYTFDIGQNDLGAGFFGNLSIQEVNASVPDIVSNFSMDFKVNLTSNAC